MSAGLYDSRWLYASASAVYADEDDVMGERLAAERQDVSDDVVALAKDTLASKNRVTVEVIELPNVMAGRGGGVFMHMLLKRII